MFFPNKKKEDCKENDKGKISSRNGFYKVNSQSSFVSNSQRVLSNGSLSSGRGPQPLRKNIISEEKMIQLRKKSLDFLEASRHRKQLDRELGLTSSHPLENQTSMTDVDLEDDIDVRFKVGGGRRDSKPDQDSPPETDKEPLHQSSPEPDSPFSPPPMRSQMSATPDSDDDDDALEPSNYTRYDLKSPPLSSSLSRAHTFNYGDTTVSAHIHVHESDDNSSEKGGSLRITRHSKRARGRVDNVFGSSTGLIISATVQGTSSYPTEQTSEPDNEGPLPESYLPTPPQYMTIKVSPPDPSSDVAPTRTMSQGRRRKAALVPLLITTTPVIEDTPPRCPFHSQSSPNFGTTTEKKSISLSPRPIRRGIAQPQSAGDAETDGSSPQPRRKKVSVAQIEATLFPPTPVNLHPPQHLSLSRSSSFNTMRTHHDVFADNAFRSVMQISQDAIVCANSIGDIVYWSKGACKMFGYTPGEAIGSSLEVKNIQSCTVKIYFQV